MVTQEMLRRMADAAAAKKAAEVEYDEAKTDVSAEWFRGRAVEPGPLAVRETTSVRQTFNLKNIAQVLGQTAADTLEAAIKKTVVQYVVVVPATAKTRQGTDGKDDEVT